MTSAARRDPALSPADIFGGHLQANTLCQGRLVLVPSMHPDAGPLVAFGFQAQRTAKASAVKLRPGDLVIIYANAPGKQVIWQGEFDYRVLPRPARNPQARPRVKMPDGTLTKLWFDRTQVGVNPERWLSWFSKRHRATVIRPQC